MPAIVRHLQITGRVQGVGFRYYMQRRAQELGITGWVRNRRDGSVEALIQGTAEAVETLTSWARRGPQSAVVSSVKIAEGGGEYSEFVMLPTE